MTKKPPSLRKIAARLFVCFLSSTSVVLGAELENWRSRDWNQETVSEFVVFASRACLEKALGAPDQQQGLTWIYTGVMVTNPEGQKSPQRLVIGFEGGSSDSKVNSVSLEAMDK